MGNFSKNTRGRSWIGTIQIANMIKAGLSKEEYETPEKVANFFCKRWEESGKERVAGASVCVSDNGLYHMHIALYGNLTTLGNVAKIMFDSHIEPQLAGKKTLKSYLLKEPPYDEKGEHVLYSVGLENLKDSQGNRSDCAEIADMLNRGYTPLQIMEDFRYRKYEKMIKSAFIDIRMKETPLIKTNKKCIWICGESGSGKTYYYKELCDKYGKEKVYLATDYSNGGLDFYIEQGAPPILFLDEFKGDILYSQLLIMLDIYSMAQVHCRYNNCYCLWNTVIITSIYPPDEVYKLMVAKEVQGRDKIDQLLRRLDVIEYRYKENNEYKRFSIPANTYVNYKDLIQRAKGDKDGFLPWECNLE